MAAETALDLIERQGWLDQLSDRLQPAIERTLTASGGQPLKNVLHGVWLGHPLHPVLTDVPIGSWTAVLVLDALDEIGGRNRFGRGADAAVAVGLVGALGAAVTGLTDWQHLAGRTRRLGLTHGLLNLSATLLYTRSWQLRRRNARREGRGFALLGYAVSIAAAYLGGHLVYGHHIGVDYTAGQPLPHAFVPVLAEAELREGELRRVEANGTPVLLVRRNGLIRAIAETCAHLGGPLAEGRLEGGSVVCPWHGSRFALEDGRVLDGPSPYPQPCLETRVRNGQIEVRRAEFH
jgi:nitrite reductase/ring-hydroxylating ferredoxin subunit/uncharacterized membrane protein